MGRRAQSSKEGGFVDCSDSEDLPVVLGMWPAVAGEHAPRNLARTALTDEFLTARPGGWPLHAWGLVYWEFGNVGDADKSATVPPPGRSSVGR